MNSNNVYCFNSSFVWICLTRGGGHLLPWGCGTQRSPWGTTVAWQRFSLCRSGATGLRQAMRERGYVTLLPIGCSLQAHRPASLLTIQPYHHWPLSLACFCLLEGLPPPSRPTPSSFPSRIRSGTGSCPLLRHCPLFPHCSYSSLYSTLVFLSSKARGWGEQPAQLLSLCQFRDCGEKGEPPNLSASGSRASRVCNRGATPRPWQALVVAKTSVAAAASAPLRPA